MEQSVIRDISKNGKDVAPGYYLKGGELRLDPDSALGKCFRNHIRDKFRPIGAPVPAFCLIGYTT